MPREQRKAGLWHCSLGCESSPHQVKDTQHVSSGQEKSPSARTNCSPFRHGVSTSPCSPLGAEPPAPRARVYPPVPNPTHTSFRRQHRDVRGSPAPRGPYKSTGHPTRLQLPARDVPGGYRAPLPAAETWGRDTFPWLAATPTSPEAAGYSHRERLGGFSHWKGPLLGKVSFPRACSQTHEDHGSSRGLGRG